MITSCYKITVDQFCDCLFEKQYEILGGGNESERQEAWNKIYVEYCDLMNDASYNESFNLVKDINALNAKIQLIGLAADYLVMVRDKDVEKILYEAGVKPHKNYDLLQKTAVSKIKRLTAELQVMQNDLDKLMSKTQDKAGRDSFENNLLVFSEQRKVHLSAQTTTVYQFCRMYKEHERLSNKTALLAR